VEHLSLVPPYVKALAQHLQKILCYTGCWAINAAAQCSIVFFANVVPEPLRKAEQVKDAPLKTSPTLLTTLG